MNYKKNLYECYNLYFMKYKNQSEKHIAHKKYVLNSFLSSLSDDVVYISREDILKWQNQFNVAPNTLNGYLIILRQFLLFAKGYGLQTDIPIIRKYVDDYIPYLFSPEELRHLIEVADNNISYSRVAGTKTFCFPMLLRLLAFSGTRLSETLTLKWKDYDGDNGILILKNTKRKKERYVPLHFTVNELLNQYKYRLQKQYMECDYLFPDNSLSTHITKQQFEYEFSKVVRKAGISVETGFYERGVCAHCLRHYFAVGSFRKAIENGIDITDTLPLLSTYLGHERLRETEKYLKFSSDLFPDAIETFEKYSFGIFAGV
ncbi:MAG TPA: tyrosine-type recombinase/integrase [Clostridiaceae bacterium]|nr:tyrosine-type recombinase/integrase [Clostridiaceae bacterium]